MVLSNKVDISVILSIYNNINYLEKCLDTIVHQTLKSIEIICIDDGSSDGSEDIVQNYMKKDRRIKLYKTNHMGAGYIRNMGLQMAKGKYVVFLDADDWFEINMLENAFEKAETEELDICIWEVTEYDDALEEYCDDNQHLRKELLPDNPVFSSNDCRYFFNFTSGAAWNKLFLTSFVKDNLLKFSESIAYNDLFFTYSALFTAHRIASLNQKLSFYRVNSKDSLQYNRENYVDDAIRAFSDLGNFLSENHPTREIIRSYQNYILSVCSSLINSFNIIENQEKVHRFFMSEKYSSCMTYVDAFYYNKEVWEDLFCNKKPEEQINLSVIIPAYNDEETISKCLDSLVVQKMKTVEFIVVDDCSDDGTYKIACQYAEKDKRFTILRHEKNMSAFLARKDGVLHAKGKYLLFVDADDTMVEDACEKAWKLVQTDNVDILHFSTNVISDNKDIDGYKKLVDPKPRYITGEKIFRSFVESNFEGHLWNKIFRRELALYALEKAGDNILPKGQDKYFYWIMAFYAESYLGKPDVALYNYYYGAGVEGKNEYSLCDFETFCKQAWTESAIERFMQDNSKLDDNNEILWESRKNLLRHTVKQLKKIQSEEKTQAVNLLCQYWGKDGHLNEIVSVLCDEYKNNKNELIGILENVKFCKPKTVKTIGTYYHIFNNGGIQRVLAQLMKIWVQQGYNVIFFTDYPESVDDYELPEGVVRITLQMNGSSAARNYKKRGEDLEYYLKEFNVDVMIYHEYFGKSMLWDMILSKLLGIPFALYYHNIFSKFLATYEEEFFTIPQQARLADGIITLSSVDKLFWSTFNKNVIMINNPLVFDLRETEKSKLKSNIILWVGRLDELHKRFMDTLQIMKLVVQKIPDAKLLIVGRDSDSKKYHLLKKAIEEEKLEDTIILCGFQKDVAPFYEMASIYLMTSTFEGYPMTLVEALSFGLPVVMYDLPYLSLVKDNEGIISVELGDINSMAREIEALLVDKEYRTKIGDLGRKYLEVTYEKKDLGKEWKHFFESLISEMSVSLKYDEKDILLMTLLNHYKVSYEINQREFRYYNRTIERLKKETRKKSDIHETNDNYAYLLEQTRKSYSYKIGRVITFFPRLVRHIIFRKPM